jgi:uncharacterized protein (TIGR03546 family)
MLTSLAKILKILNSEAEPGQISLAIALGMVAGFMPLFSLPVVIAWLLVCLLRINLATFLLVTPLFAGAAYLLDPLFHRVGLAFLSAPWLESLWTAMYNSTFWRLQNFNNSVVMGSFVTALILIVPCYLLANLLIRRYRQHILAWVERSRVMQLFKASDFYKLYLRVSAWGVRS